MKFNLHAAAAQLLEKVKQLDSSIQRVHISVGVGTEKQEKRWYAYAWGEEGNIKYSSCSSSTYGAMERSILSEIMERQDKDEQIIFNPETE
jgi:saccharopine dehydrogenase-like NADP-dependent oxidoreductase